MLHITYALKRGLCQLYQICASWHSFSAVTSYKLQHPVNSKGRAYVTDTPSVTVSSCTFVEDPSSKPLVTLVWLLRLSSNAVKIAAVTGRQVAHTGSVEAADTGCLVRSRWGLLGLAPPGCLACTATL